MCTATATAPTKAARKPRKPPVRTMRIEADPFGGGLIRITMDGKATIYRSVMIPCDPSFGPYAMELAKLDDDLKVVEVYHLTVSHGIPERVACDCRGHLRWGHCKHGAAIAKILHDQFNEPIPADILAAYGPRRLATLPAPKQTARPNPAVLDHF